jgi:hypothetical protein
MPAMALTVVARRPGPSPPYHALRTTTAEERRNGACAKKPWKTYERTISMTHSATAIP